MEGLLGIGGGVSLVAARDSSSIAAPADRVPVCHATGDDSSPWVLIEVADASLAVHEAHGDGQLGSDAHCGTCGKACDTDNCLHCIGDQCLFSCAGTNVCEGQGNCGPCIPQCPPGVCGGDDGCGGTCGGCTAGEHCRLGECCLAVLSCCESAPDCEARCCSEQAVFDSTCASQLRCDFAGLGEPCGITADCEILPGPVICNDDFVCACQSGEPPFCT